MPMDTMRPVTPARLNDGAIVVCPRAEMMAHRRAPVTARPATTTMPSSR